MTQIPPDFILRITFSSTASLQAFGESGSGAVPYISGATLKGAIRSAADKILEMNAVAHCSRREHLESCESKPCPICSIFGRRGSLGKVVFEGAIPVAAPGNEPDASRRDSRFLPGRQRPGRRECHAGAAVLYPPMTFAARLIVLYPLSRTEEQLLLSSVATIRTLGAGKARGMGFCTIHFEKEAREIHEAIITADDLGAGDNRVGVILAAESPIVVSEAPVGSTYRTTLDYIPGAAFKSACFEHIRRLEKLDALAAELVNGILAPSVYFSDCLPMAFGNPQTPDANKLLDLPEVAPFSADCCSDSICSGDSIASRPDTLIHSFVLQECYRSEFPYIIDRCRDLEYDRAIAGRSTTMQRERPVSVQIDTASFCPIERNSRRTVSDSQHCVSFIQAGTLFAGTIAGLRPSGKEALMRLAVEKISIGALRSRGFGRITMRLKALPPRQDIQEAIQAFNESVKREFEEIARVWNGASTIHARMVSEGALFFSIGLLSDLMLPEWTLWEQEQNPLEALLGQAGIPAQTVFLLTKGGKKGGWNAACRAPRGLTQIIRRGSVAMYRINAAGETKNDIIKRLENIQESGLGLRANDGFGALSICNRFHTIGYPRP
ncbi:MAG: hypothetical protein JW941_11810 [Candidatus Coatesbacteria bacterium]|nr:hypothetical protein [Candidatus Coatesbacteria bacterium]